MHFSLISQGLSSDKGVVDRSFLIGLTYIRDCPPIFALILFTDHAQSRVLKFQQFATQVINSKPPHSFSFENPIVWPVSLFTSNDVIVSRTAFSSLLISNFIFLIPRPAFCETCFSVAVGTLVASLSAKHTNVALQVHFFSFF